MDWTTAGALGLFGVICAHAAHRAATERWSVAEAAGPTVFLLGAGAGLFLDDLLAPGSQLQPWIEPVAAAVALAGAVAWWRTAERDAGSSQSSP